MDFHITPLENADHPSVFYTKSRANIIRYVFQFEGGIQQFELQMKVEGARSIFVRAVIRNIPIFNCKPS